MTFTKYQMLAHRVVQFERNAIIKNAFFVCEVGDSIEVTLNCFPEANRLVLLAAEDLHSSIEDNILPVSVA